MPQFPSRTCSWLIYQSARFVMVEICTSFYQVDGKLVIKAIDMLPECLVFNNATTFVILEIVELHQTCWELFQAKLKKKRCLSSPPSSFLKFLLKLFRPAKFFCYFNCLTSNFDLHPHHFLLDLQIVFLFSKFVSLILMSWQKMVRSACVSFTNTFHTLHLVWARAISEKHKYGDASLF